MTRKREDLTQTTNISHTRQRCCYKDTCKLENTHSHRERERERERERDRDRDRETERERERERENK